MESLSLALALIFLLFLLPFTIRAVRRYRALATSDQRAADEEQYRKFCQAENVKQEKFYQTQLKALQAKYDSEKRVNGSLRHEKSTLENIHEPLVTKSGRQQREIDNLTGALEEATYDRSTVENANYVKEQWNLISGTLAKAGFVAKTLTDLARSIKKLLELRDPAVAPSDQAALDKKELAKENAAKEAHLAKERAEMINNLQIQYNKEKDEMIKELQGQYIKEKDDMIKELQGEYNQAVATEVNTQLNKHHYGELGNEPAASAATEIESLKNYATKLQKQLERAHEATTQAEGKLRDAESTVGQKDQEIAALYKEARGAIAEKDIKIEALGDEITRMQNATMSEAMNSAAFKTASGNLELELVQARSKISQDETTLNNVNKEIEGMRAERQRMMAECQGLLAQGQKLQIDLESAAKQLQTQREQSNGGIATGTPQLQQLQMQLDDLKNELDAVGKAAQKHKEEAQSLTVQLRSTNDDFEKLRVKTKQGNQQLRDCINDMREHKELKLAFEGQVKGVDPVGLTKIITDNCEEYRNAGDDAEIDFDKLPICVQYHLLAYMHKNKKVDKETKKDGETKNDDKSKVGIKVEDREKKTPKSRRNQPAGLQPQQQLGTPAPSNSFTFPPQSSNSQYGGLQPQRNATQAPLSTFNFGAQSSNSQQQHGTSAPSVPYTFDSWSTPFQ